MAENKNRAEVPLSRSALGRVAFIGELFDAKTESFSSRSLFKSSFPSNLVEVQDIGQTEFEYKFADTFSDRFDLLNVEGEIQVDFLLGLISVSGSGRFLTETTESGQCVSCSLVYSTVTVCEKFFASFSEILEHIDLNALENTESTHMVSEVIWGAKCLLSLDAEYKSESNKQELEGKLGAQMSKLKKILSTSGSGALGKNESNCKGLEDVHIKVCADLVPEGNWPTSIESFCQFVKDVPQLLAKVNNGKGKQMNYVMIPLTIFRKLAKVHIAVDKVVMAIDEGLLISIVFLFEEIAALKRKFHDLVKKMTDMEMYVVATDLKKLKEHQNTLALKESDLKLILSENWSLVKSGKKSFREMVTRLEKFKSRDLKLQSYEEYLDSTTAILKKLDLIKYFMSLGILYLGRGDDLSVLLSQNLSCEFLVLLTSSKTKKKDQNLDYLTTNYFLDQVRSSKSTTKYVVIDFDYQEGHSFMNYEIETTKCFHLNGDRIISSDKFDEYDAERKKNFVSLAKSKIIAVMYRPEIRVQLKMTCPGFPTGTCFSNKLLWHCFHCKSAVEYGFDDHFYCACGKSAFYNFQYRCSDPNHKDFFMPQNTSVIKNELDTLKSFEEMNILILGQSGVGKSTWVNSIANYLKYESLDAAKKHGPICTIPASFTVYDSVTLKKHIVQLGREDKNEVTAVGRSATQYAHTYTFVWGGRRVRIIDTPGLGDTSGIAQDKLHLKNIMRHIGHLKKLHGVCILLRANESRIHAVFSYCLRELLCHLHKNVTKNIVFCFTNSRNSFYTPGQSSALLENILCKLGVEKDLSLGPNNMFCMDNEAFLFLCSLSNPEINYKEELIKSFSESWELSLKETKRLFYTIRAFEPHELRETVSLVTARNRILSLSKPLVDISKTLQMNLAVIQRKKQELKAADEALEELSKKLNMVEIHLESVPLDHPRTVCTSPSCVEYHKFSFAGIQNIEYKTHCHSRCYLEYVEVSTVNNSALIYCEAMNNGTCSFCGCGWEKHMHITYSQFRVEKQVINKSVEKIVEQEKSEKKKIEIIVNELENQIKKYREEQEFITRASVMFGMFLRSNAIAAYNDGVLEYLEYLIEEEEAKPFKSKMDKDLLQGLKDMLAQYKTEVKTLQAVLEKAENTEDTLSLEEMLRIEKELYKLELTGDSIRKAVECERFSNLKMKQYLETPLLFSNSEVFMEPLKAEEVEESQNSILSRVKKVFSKFYIF